MAAAHGNRGRCARRGAGDLDPGHEDEPKLVRQRAGQIVGAAEIAAHVRGDIPSYTGFTVR